MLELNRNHKHLRFPYSIPIADYRWFMVIVGGIGNKVNSWDGDETLQILLWNDARLVGFSVRWTTTHVIITGFQSDPGASIEMVNGAAGTVTWNEAGKILTLDLPWDNGIARKITFANSAASADSTLNHSFTNEAPGWQASFTSFEYLPGTPPPADPTLEFRQSPRQGHHGEVNLTNPAWASRTRTIAGKSRTVRFVSHISSHEVDFHCDIPRPRH